MKPTYHHYSEGSLTRIVTVSFLFAATSLTALAQTDDLFVSFHDTDTISLYNAITGALVNSAFASVQSPTGLVVGPDNNLYVGSDNLSGAEGAGIVTFGINGVTSGPAQDYVTHIDDNNLNNPRGLAFIGSTLYVADLTSGNVMIYPTAHTAGTTLASANINGASGLSASGGNLYIADINEGNVLRYDGATVTQVNAVDNTFISAQDVAIGHDGNLYVLNPRKASTNSA